MGLSSRAWIPAFETVSQFVIPAKPHERGREPESRSTLDDLIFLDSGSRPALQDSSGMTAFSQYDTACFAGMTNSGYLVTGAHHALSLLAIETQTIRFWTRGIFRFYSGF